MIDPREVSACLVTRGNVPMQRILDTLTGFGEVIVVDNSQEPQDWKVAGRYEAVRRARFPIVALQDDDVIFTRWAELLAGYEPGVLVANDAHGPNHGGYDDLALVAAGAVCDRDVLLAAADRYLVEWPDDDVWRYEADFVVGCLTPHRHLVLPYERLYGDDDTRLCRQPWQEDLKLRATRRARRIRGSVSLEQPGSVTIARGWAAA